jgi:hypothetical protein
MEPGESGGGRERGEGRDAPGFDPSDFSDIADLADERAQERPGRFGATSIAGPRSFDFGGSVFSFVRNMLSSFPALTPLGPVPGMAMSLANIATMKARGYSDEEIDKAFGVGAMGLVPGFGAAMAVGKGLQRAARAMGATGGPQTTFGDRPAGPGTGGVRDVDPYGDTTKFDRGQLLRDARQAALQNRLGGV